MAVRVKIRLKLGGSSLDTVALANAGYESGGDLELILPERLVWERWPHLLKGSVPVPYGTAGGRVEFRRLLYQASIQVVTEDKETAPVECVVVSSPYADEVLLSDHLIQALEIVLVKPGEGLWRFLSDASEMPLRRSPPPQRW